MLSSFIPSFALPRLAPRPVMAAAPQFAGPRTLAPASPLDMFDIEPAGRRNAKAATRMIIDIEQDELGNPGFDRIRKGMVKTLQMNRNVDESRFWVLREKNPGRFGKGKIVGVGGYFTKPLADWGENDEPRPNVAHPDKTALLCNLYIDSKYRGMGVGKALVERLMREARAAGLQQMILAVHNEDAMRAYERMGFRTYHEYDHVRHNGQVLPSRRMWKPLLPALA